MRPSLVVGGRRHAIQKMARPCPSSIISGTACNGASYSSAATPARIAPATALAATVSEVSSSWRDCRIQKRRYVRTLSTTAAAAATATSGHAIPIFNAATYTDKSRPNNNPQKRTTGGHAIPIFNAATSTVKSRPNNNLQKRTNALLDPTEYPVGWFPADEAREAAQVVQDWIALPPSHPSAQKSVLESMRLLERLIQEQVHIDATADTFYIVGLDLTDLLAKVLGHWERSFRQSRYKEGLSSPGRMLELLHEYRSQLPHLRSPITTQMYNTVLRGYWTTANADPKGSIAGAMDLVKDMVQFHKEERQKQAETQEESSSHHIDPIVAPCAPNTRTFELLLQICIRAGSIQSAVDTLDYLLALQEDEETSTAAVRLPSKIFERLFHTCTTVILRSRRDRGRLADQIFERMVQCRDQDVLTERIQVEHYTQVMQAWAKSKDPQSAQRCMDILHDLQHQARHNGKIYLEPDVYVYAGALDAWANLGAAREAEELLETMCDEYQSTKTGRNTKSHATMRARPHTSHFNIVLNAWANSKAYEAGERAENLLRFMERTFAETNGVWRIRPDKISFNSAIRAWGVSGHPERSTRAQALFQEMLDSGRLKPDTRTCAAILHIWALDGNVEKAARLLGYMCTEFDENGNTDLEPNVYCFAVVLDALAKSKHPLAGRDAEAVLRKMAASGRPSVAPTTFCYNSVIHAYAQSGDHFAGYEAERLLRKMSQEGKAGAAPDLVSYNSTINAFARSKKIEDAERLLLELHSISKHNPQLKPDAMSYNCVLNAHAKNGNVEGVELLLLEMEKHGVKPDAFSLGSALEAWSRSGSPEGGEKADMYLERMKAYPEKRMGYRYRLAHMCWRNSQGHNPRAEQRMKELGEVLTQLEAGNKY